MEVLWYMFLLITPVIWISISLKFWRCSEEKGIKEIFASIHGSLIALVSIICIAASFSGGIPSHLRRSVTDGLFIVILLISLLSIIASFFWFKGNKKYLYFHFLTVPGIFHALFLVVVVSGGEGSFP